MKMGSRMMLMTAPMTVVKGDGRTQVRIRKEPDSKSAAIGILTRATQGIRVIETLDNGWSLIECYSSSFADNTVKAWNLLVQGYVETNTLTTVEWDSNDKYGLVVDKLTQRLYVYEDGHLISTLLVSTGLANAKQPFNETRSGEYIIGSFTGEFTSGNLYCGMGLRYNDGDLLHEVPHTKRADGSKSYAYNEPKLGTRASHGCIRVQRLRNTEGLNMKWLWDNRKHLGRLVIWEDWQGRQIPIPDDDTVLYYNPNGGSYYHRADTCYSVTKDNVTFEAFTYAQLDEEPYSKLDFCPYCAPAMRKADIEAINAQYVFGGDHDPILTSPISTISPVSIRRKRPRPRRHEVTHEHRRLRHHRHHWHFRAVRAVSRLHCQRAEHGVRADVVPRVLLGQPEARRRRAVQPVFSQHAAALHGRIQPHRRP